jgi:hypothetical protein
LFFKEVFGLEISQGSMVNWVKEAKQAAKPVIDKIKEFIKSSSVVGFDESGCYCNKKARLGMDCTNGLFHIGFTSFRTSFQRAGKPIW